MIHILGVSAQGRRSRVLSVGENLNKACGPQAFSVSSSLQVGGEGGAHGALLEQLLIGAASEMKEDSDLSRWRVRWRPVCDIFEGRVYLPSQTLCPDLLRPMLDHQFYGSLESNRAGLPQGKDFIALKCRGSFTHSSCVPVY